MCRFQRTGSGCSPGDSEALTIRVWERALVVKRAIGVVVCVSVAFMGVSAEQVPAGHEAAYAALGGAGS